MKSIFRKSVIWLMILFLSVGTIGTFLPSTSATAEAADTPKYMLKMVHRKDGNNDNRLGQYINVKAGVRYTLSFEVYTISEIPQGELINLQTLWGADTYPDVTQKINYANRSGKGEVTGDFTPASDGNMFLNFQITSDTGEFYLWDIKLTKEGDSTNLLQNADFSQGNGSLVNWTYSGWGGAGATKITDVSGSDKFESTTGRKVLLYNEELFSNNISNREDLELTGDPMYMAHIGKYWKRIEQNLTVEEELATYTLTYKYYKNVTGNLQSRIGYDKNDTSGTFKAYNDITSTGIIKNGEVVFEKPAGTTSLFIRFEGTDKSNGVDGYIWDVKLIKNDGDGTNLLRNADFIQGGGSWIGWNISDYGDISSVDKSNQAGLETNCEILAYDTKLFAANEEFADWSVQPILEETLDFNYKVTLKQAASTDPTMTFVMRDGTEIIREETVQGNQIVDAKNGYTFSFKILPQQMAYNITATLMVDGEEQTKVYSVKKYCAVILANDAHSQYLKDLVADLLRYGDATQKQLKLTETITSGLSSLVANYGNTAELADDTTHLTSLLSGTNSGAYIWKSASLVLNGKVVIRLKFRAENGVEGLSVMVGEKSYEISQTGSDYYIDIPMAAAAFADTVTAQFQTSTGQQGASLQYSVNTYLFRNKAKSGWENLMDTIYKYGKSADIYYEYVTTGKVESTVTTGLDNDLSDTWSL